MYVLLNLFWLSTNICQEIINSILAVKKLITSLLFILKTTSPEKEVNTVAIAGLTGEITDEFDTLLNNLSCMSAIMYRRREWIENREDNNFFLILVLTC